MSQDVVLANQTMDLLETCVAADGGARYRKELRHCMTTVEDAYRTSDSVFREHLGASLIGRECARELWMSFRWCTAPDFEPRMLRLFNRGHLEEGRIVALLLSCGLEVWQHDENGKQFRVTGYKGHFGGSLDAVVRGIPEMPDEPVLAEFKTHNDKSFTKLLSEGVRKAKPEHFAQMQIYMKKMQLLFALYIAVNKNDDTIYCELIAFDSVQADRFETRAAMIIDANEPPPRVNESPGWWKCKFCGQAPVCHGQQEPERNCRTCRWSTPIEDATWICEFVKPPRLLPPKKQEQGCPTYSEHPGIRARS